MSKFHINEKGEPGKCSAEVACPFGSDDNHYPSPEVARQAYEESNAHQQVPTVSKKIAKFLRGGSKKDDLAITLENYNRQDFDDLPYDDVTYDEEHRADKMRRVVADSYKKISRSEREEIVQKKIQEQRARWYRMAETEPAVSYQRQVPLRLVPVGTDIMGDDGNGGRKVIGRVEAPSEDEYANFSATYSDLDGTMHYVDPHHPVDVGVVEETDSKKSWGVWERQQKHALRLAENRAKFDQIQKAGKVKSGS